MKQLKEFWKGYMDMFSDFINWESMGVFCGFLTIVALIFTALCFVTFLFQ
jgi:hypothetical protein